MCTLARSLALTRRFVDDTTLATQQHMAHDDSYSTRVDTGPCGRSATGTPSAPCFRMNAFCASENFDAFIGSAPPSLGITPPKTLASNASIRRVQTTFEHAPDLGPGPGRSGASTEALLWLSG